VNIPLSIERPATARRSRLRRLAPHALLAAAALAAGCADLPETKKGTATGAAIGTVAGAAIGAATGSAATGALIGVGAGALGGYLWSHRMEEQKRSMEQATQGTGVTVTQTADNQLKIEVPSDVSFDTGRADIKPNLRPILDKFAQGLVSNASATVRIVGHTDSRGSDAINDPLSVNRAASVRDYLTTRGVAASKIAIDGRGSHEPIADNATEAGRAKNRRVEIFMGEQRT
jgi:outer membrane protein OmpA-like peptidoglycan-associated protein